MEKITLFRGANHPDKPIAQVPIDDFLNDVKHGKYADVVLKVRNITDKDTRQSFKLNNLPVATVSGTFSYKDQKNLIEHSGFICLDFDKFPKTIDLDAARSLLYADQYTYAGFVSCSGNGIALVVRIEKCKSNNLVYKVLEDYYIGNYGLKPDPAPKNVSSGRYVSYDPDLYINKNSAVYVVPGNKKPREDFVAPTYNHGTTPWGAKALDEIIAEMRATESGARNTTLYGKAFRLGCLVAGGEISEADAQFLKSAAKDTGLPDAQIERTFKDGFSEGKRQPASAPEKPFVPNRKKSSLSPTPPPAPQNETQPGDPPPPPVQKSKPALSANNEMFKPLGFVKAADIFKYVFFNKKTNQIISYSAAALKRNTIVEIAPAWFWKDYYETDNGGVAVQAVVDWLISAAMKAGYFDTSRFRGRGVWFDNGNTVVHDGNKLIVNNTAVELGDFQSEYIYEAGKPLGFSVENPLHDKDARQYLVLSKYIAFKRKIDHYLFIGWGVIAPFCGALRYRPHLWTDGKSTIGKSWVNREILRPMLGNTAVAVQGRTTAAGIVQRLRSDALNVVIDEAFGENVNDIERLQQIVELARCAFTDDSGEVLKGNTTQTGVSFQVRGCFAFASILDILRNKSDLSRFAVITLVENPKKRWENLQLKTPLLMQRERIARLHARTLRLLPVILKNIKTISVAVAENVGSQRIGDMLAPMLAGAYSLYSSAEITADDAKRWAAKLEIPQEIVNTDETDEMSLIDLILSEVITVYVAKEVKRKTIGQLIQIASGMNTDDMVSRADAAAELELLGIKCSGAFVCFKYNHKGISKILEKTKYAKNYHKVLLRMPNAKSISIYFAGVKQTNRVAAIHYDEFGFDMLYDNEKGECPF